MSDLYGPLDEKKKKRKKAGTESSKESSLRDWFGRKGAKGKKKGWVDCNAPDGKGGYKSCGRGSGEKRKKYPACRPTPGACKERGRGKSWGKKAKKRKNEELYMDLEQIIQEELEAVLDEKRKKKKKKKAKRDACYHKVKSRYKVWPSAYASGALVKCRKVGAKNWGNSKKESIEIQIENEIVEELVELYMYEETEKYLEESFAYGLIEEDDELTEKKKKKGCKPAKGKKYARRVKGRCVSYGAKGYKIAPGTSKGNSYCARSYGDMKSHGKDCSGKDRSTPLCLSRKKWKCSGKYSRKGK
tara:strand:+ start:5904 stop:6806 length:903 start_codon:yes stop_codon:yes gene_type:complete